MTATANLYGNASRFAFLGDIKFTTDAIKMILVTASYTPNLGTDEYYSTPQADECSGTGYTAGGNALTSCTVTTTTANSWTVEAAVSTAYTVGQVVRPVSANGYLYRCAVAGTSGATAPAWPTVVGETVADGTVTWTCEGQNITVLSSAAVNWSTLTLGTAATYGVIYDSTPGSAATDPLVALYTFAAGQNGAALQVSPDPNLGWGYWVS